MLVGIDSFAATFDENSRALNPADRLRQLVEQIEHAAAVGLDAFGIGEHHCREFLDSAQAVILGAAAARPHALKPTARRRARPARQSTRPRDQGVLTAVPTTKTRGPARLEE